MIRTATAASFLSAILAAQAGNPPAADPFARSFEGDGLRLELSGAAAGGYRGRLLFQGQEYPAEASATGKQLRGRFTAGADRFEFTASLAGDQLTLVSDGNTYHLAGTPAAASEPAQIVPQALTGVFSGKTSRYDHPRGWFSFDMPERWTVFQLGDTGMLLNPGLTAQDTLDAIVGLMWGRLEQQDLNQPVAAVIEKHIPELKRGLGEQGLSVGEPEGRIATFRGKDVPGAVVTFATRNQQGRELKVWFGGIVKRDSWIAVSGVMLAEKEAGYLPQCKRIFTSLEPKPPERNPKLEAALVGKTFTSSQYGRLTPSAHHASYAFQPGGLVTRRLMSNIASEPGMPGASADSERQGRYEVCGDVLFLYFETGQEAGQVLQQGAQVNGIRLGNAEYR
jgi:hypothetical protein